MISGLQTLALATQMIIAQYVGPVTDMNHAAAPVIVYVEQQPAPIDHKKNKKFTDKRNNKRRDFASRTRQRHTNNHMQFQPRSYNH